MHKPTILVYGNCQASAMAQTFSKLPGIKDLCEVRYLASFVHPVDGVAPIHQDWLDRCLVFIEQKGAWTEFPRKAELPTSTVSLSFPTVSMNSLWPLHANDPRNRTEPPDYPFGRYPYGDRLVMELLDKGYAGKELLKEYMGHDIGQMLDLDRFFELESERLRLADAACDIKMADFVLSNFRNERLFWSHNHPTSQLFKHLFHKILSGLGQLAGSMDVVELNQWLDNCYRNWEPAGEISVAVHPQVARHFQLEWVDSKTKYWHFRAAPAGFDEYMLNYINFAQPFALCDAGQWLGLSEPPIRLRRVNIEVTTWCNLDCPGCGRTICVGEGTWVNKHMPLDTFRRVVEHLPPVELGVLQGVGEPTMNPDYLEMVSIAKASGRFARLHCNTNAMARNVEFYVEMVERGLDNFSVSVDSLKPEIVELTRTGTNVDKLIDRLKMFHQLDLPFTIQMVVSRINYDDIFFTLHTLNQIGPRTVFIQPFIDANDSGKALPRNMAILFLKRLENLSSQFGNLTIHASGFQSLGIKEKSLGLPMCTSPWLDPSINVDGFMTPCCVHWSPDTLGRSNLAELPYDEIWHSEPVRRFMASYIDGPPLFCMNCSENVRSNTHGEAA